MLRPEGVKITENYYGSFFEGESVQQMQRAVQKAIEDLKTQGKWRNEWDAVAAAIDEHVQRHVGLDHVTFQHCNDVAPEGAGRLETIKANAQAVEKTIPMFRVLGLAISPKVMALQMALTFPNWDPAQSLPEDEKKLLDAVSKKKYPHVTVSLADGATAVESNYLIEELGLGYDGKQSVEKETKYGPSAFVPLGDADINVTGRIEAKEYSYFKK